MDKIRLNAFNSVPTTGTATLNTGQLAGYSLHGLQFVRGGGAFTTAMISDITIRQNGKDLVTQITGARLLDLNEYDGLADQTNNNFLYFGDPTARTLRGQHIGDFDFTVYPGQLEIMVGIAGATTPTLEVIAHVGAPKAAMLGAGFNAQDVAAFRALKRTVLDPGAAVSDKQYPISLGAAPGALIRKVGLFHTNITRASWRKNSIIKHDNLTIAENAAYQGVYARVPQSGLYMIDFIADGNVGEAEPTLDSKNAVWNHQLGLTTSGADTVTAYADLLTNLALL